ncbi:MAG: hypothetical protein A3J24_10755 [Deltaproteobacteria bacterium RIFCSPLOWO2_02_FULL_53_8]|nr:MAG: hypothetical protein A3J24_10755 [Deltaproteobacteria bacterium RIFCSPLOWO2_02_FULL_53_8]
MVSATVLKRVFMSNGNPLTDPDPSLSPAAVKDFWAAMYPELLNAEVQGPVNKDGELTYTFHRTTGTKGAAAKGSTQKVRAKLPAHVASFLRCLEAAAPEASKSRSKPGGQPSLADLKRILHPQVGGTAMTLSSSSCPLLL